jgi:transposase
MKAYCLDLRTKIVQSVSRRGVSISETAHRFGVNHSTVGRYLKRLDEEGSLAPKKAPGTPSKLDESAMRLLEEDIKARPWATHKQRSEFQTEETAALNPPYTQSRRLIYGYQRC